MSFTQVPTTLKEGIDLILKRGYYFPPIEKFLKDSLVLKEKIFQNKRLLAQKELVEYVVKYSHLIALANKIIRFYRKGRHRLWSCLEKGSSDVKLRRWEDSEKQDRIRGMREIIEENEVSRYIAISFLRKFFLAAPELFAESTELLIRGSSPLEKSEVVNISPFFDKDLYFLGRSKKSLNSLYRGLKKDNSRILKVWLKILGF